MLQNVCKVRYPAKHIHQRAPVRFGSQSEIISGSNHAWIKKQKAPARGLIEPGPFWGTALQLLRRAVRHKDQHLDARL